MPIKLVSRIKVTQRAPLERIRERVVDQIVVDPVPQITKGILAGVQHVPQEGVAASRRGADWE